MDRFIIRVGDTSIEVEYPNKASLVEITMIDYYNTVEIYLDKSEIGKLRDYFNQVLGEKDV